MWGGYAGHDRFYAASIQEMRWDHPLMVEAMEYWNSQVQAGWWGGDLETYYSMGYADANSALMEGDALMMINGTWVTESLISMEAESGNHWNFVQTPPLRDGVEPVYELSIGESIALSASAKHRDAAGTVLNFLFEDTTSGRQDCRVDPLFELVSAAPLQGSGLRFRHRRAHHEVDLRVQPGDRARQDRLPGVGLLAAAVQDLGRAGDRQGAQRRHDGGRLHGCVPGSVRGRLRRGRHADPPGAEQHPQSVTE